MKIELPFPSSDLHAHAKGHWRSKVSPTKDARTLAKFMCLDMLNRKQIEPIAGHVLVSYAFFVPSNLRRDQANMIQACKPYIDGIVDAGVCEGDSWQEMSINGVFVEIDKKNPRVEITINATTGKKSC